MPSSLSSYSSSPDLSYLGDDFSDISPGTANYLFSTTNDGVSSEDFPFLRANAGSEQSSHPLIASLLEGSPFPCSPPFDAGSPLEPLVFTPTYFDRLLGLDRHSAFAPNCGYTSREPSFQEEQLEEMTAFINSNYPLCIPGEGVASTGEGDLDLPFAAHNVSLPEEVQDASMNESSNVPSLAPDPVNLWLKELVLSLIAKELEEMNISVPGGLPTNPQVPDGAVKKPSHGKKRDDKYIPRPPNSYMNFRSWINIFLPKVKVEHENPDILRNGRVRVTIISNVWNALKVIGPEYQLPWLDMANKSKEWHKVLHPNYKYTPDKKKKKVEAARAPEVKPPSTQPERKKRSRQRSAKEAVLGRAEPATVPNLTMAQTLGKAVGDSLRMEGMMKSRIMPSPQAANVQVPAAFPIPPMPASTSAMPPTVSYPATAMPSIVSYPATPAAPYAPMAPPMIRIPVLPPVLQQELLKYRLPPSLPAQVGISRFARR